MDILNALVRSFKTRHVHFTNMIEQIHYRIGYRYSLGLTCNGSWQIIFFSFFLLLLVFLSLPLKIKQQNVSDCSTYISVKKLSVWVSF